METQAEDRPEKNPAPEAMQAPRDLERLDALVRRRFGQAPGQILRIEAGLGDRRFYRIELSQRDPSSLIARVEPTPTAAPKVASPSAWLPEPPLEPIRRFLEQSGLPVPRSYAHDRELGIDLLEDLGSRTLASVEDDRRRERYFEACRLIPRLQRLEASPETLPAFGRIFDRELIRTKAWKFVHWCWPGLMGRDATSQERELIEAGFAAIGELLAGAPRRLAHRDFKAENLLLCSRNSDPESLVMIDVQGAFMAPPEYDLVCLLRDPQVDVAEDLVRDALESTLSELPDAIAPDEAQLRFDAISFVLQAKILSHLIEAGRSRGDRRRWHEIPRGLRLLEDSMGRIEHAFAPIRALSSVILTLTRSVGVSDIDDSR
ncbi:MAG: phosphotransferase [Deltaproteobacteria bacterium]|nr:phosphotransferase [Deltaproteobacteria bacterium]